MKNRSPKVYHVKYKSCLPDPGSVLDLDVLVVFQVWFLHQDGVDA